MRGGLCGTPFPVPQTIVQSPTHARVHTAQWLPSVPAARLPFLLVGVSTPWHMQILCPWCDGLTFQRIRPFLHSNRIRSGVKSGSPGGPFFLNLSGDFEIALKI